MAKKTKQPSLDEGSNLTPPDLPQTTESNEREAPKIERLEKYLYSKYEFYRDAIQEEIYYRPLIDGVEYEKLNEDAIRYELLKAGFSRFDAELKAIFRGPVMDERNEIHETFQGLPAWDAKDHFKELCQCIKLTNETSEERKRLENMLLKHLVRSIACALNPRFTNRFQFVWYSEAQHVGKSQLVRWLCPEPMREDYYFEVSAFSGADKDFLSQLRYCFFINFDEMAGLDKNDQNEVKAMISQESVRLRLPYAAKFETRPRIANFWGTTNKREFLTDETGSSRYIVFDISAIDWKRYTKTIDSNQLWAQIYYLYGTNQELLKISPEELAANETANSTYKLQTDEANLIYKLIEPGPYAHNDPGIVEMTSTDILEEIKKRVITNNRLNSHNLGKALKQLGYNQVNSYVNEKKFSIKKWQVKFIMEEQPV